VESLTKLKEMNLLDRFGSKSVAETPTEQGVMTFSWVLKAA
jgi:hypothetical protein